MKWGTSWWKRARCTRREDGGDDSILWTLQSARCLVLSVQSVFPLNLVPTWWLWLLSIFSFIFSFIETTPTQRVRDCFTFWFCIPTLTSKWNRWCETYFFSYKDIFPSNFQSLVHGNLSGQRENVVLNLVVISFWPEVGGAGGTFIDLC